MPLRQHRHHVGADFVGHVTVGCHPIGAHHHGVDTLVLHQVTGGVVGDQRHINPFGMQFPSGQSGTLQQRAGLVCQHPHPLALCNGGANHTQGSPVAGGGQRPGVAVRQDQRISR